jgi:hypothetical protein
MLLHYDRVNHRMIYTEMCAPHRPAGAGAEVTAASVTPPHGGKLLEDNPAARGHVAPLQRGVMGALLHGLQPRRRVGRQQQRCHWHPAM